MATAIRMPDFGTNVEQVKLIRWLKQVGEPVKRGELLCEVETDKAVAELESVAEGILLNHAVPEDADVEQDTVIAYVGAAGETPPSAPEPATAVPPGPAAPPAPVAAAPTPTGDIQAAPMIRNLAKKEGVDLSRVTGTGPGGRITREDVLKAKATPAAPAAGRPLNANQLAVARRVARSQREIPPIALEARLDMTNVLRLRAGMAKKTGKKPSFDAFFVKAVATAMQEFPHFRAHLENERVLDAEEVTIGVAIGVGHELYVPTIRAADTKDLSALDAEIRSFAAQAASGKFMAEQLTGATLSISNLGMLPVRAFHALVPPDQVAVLSIGATEDTPVVRAGAPAIAPLAHVAPSVDHRLINGLEAAQFLTRVKVVVEGKNE